MRNNLVEILINNIFGSKNAGSIIFDLAKKFDVNFCGFAITPSPLIQVEINPINHKLNFSGGFIAALEKYGSERKDDIIKGVVAHEFAHTKQLEKQLKQKVSRSKASFRMTYFGLYAMLTGVLHTLESVVNKHSPTEGLVHILVGDALLSGTSPTNKALYFKQSRINEYDADKKAAEVVGKDVMIKTLEFLKIEHKELYAQLHSNYDGINTIKTYPFTAMAKTEGFLKNDHTLIAQVHKLVTSLYQLGSTHPLLKNRISALEKLNTIDVKGAGISPSR